MAWPLAVRILALAWVTTPDGGLAAGHLSTWSDGSAHLAYAGRFSGGGVVPIDSPIAAGEPARYHLLADFFAAQVSLLGVSLPSALAITSRAPALAVPAVLKKANLAIKDVDLFELNEAFAAQVLQNMKEGGIPEEKVNICGGAIAMGHPIGCSGARVLTTLIHQLKRTGGKRGVAALCLGGGNAVAMLVEV